MSIQAAVEMANSFVATCDAGDCNEDTVALVLTDEFGWMSYCAVHAAIEAEHMVEQELEAILQPTLGRQS